MATQLSVNLNKIALLRNARGSDYPSVLAFAKLAVAAGAKSLTIHPRPDQRHITVKDVQQLGDYIQSLPAVEFNIEGNPFAPADPHSDDCDAYPGLLPLVTRTLPAQVTLVPDSHHQLTSDHGFDLRKDGERLREVLHTLSALGVRSSLFMDPDIAQIKLAKALGADRIELYTGPYAQACAQSPQQGAALLNTYGAAGDYARSIGLGVNAGHDLNLHNLPGLLNRLPIDEVSIGQALTVDALLLSYKGAIKAYSQLCQQT